MVFLLSILLDTPVSRSISGCFRHKGVGEPRGEESKQRGEKRRSNVVVMSSRWIER